MGNSDPFVGINKMMGDEREMSMDELLIPSDLYVLHRKARWGNATIAYAHEHAPQAHDIPPTLVTLIERIARAEAENGRLKAPVSDAEKIIVTAAFNQERNRVWEDSFTAGSIEESTYAALNALTDARAQQPSTQEKVID